MHPTTAQLQYVNAQMKNKLGLDPPSSVASSSAVRSRWKRSSTEKPDSVFHKAARERVGTVARYRSLRGGPGATKCGNSKLQNAHNCFETSPRETSLCQVGEGAFSSQRGKGMSLHFHCSRGSQACPVGVGPSLQGDRVDGERWCCISIPNPAHWKASRKASKESSGICR